jgi:predicted Rossmann fold nucleotide-binding protein DprA/Smf involved in DNA uptake
MEMGKTVVGLSQDFRTEFGRGAIKLQENGAVLVQSEEEALHAIFSRLGGCTIRIPARKSKKVFSFLEFQKLHQTNIPETLALLEQALIRGEIKRTGFDRFEQIKTN